MMRPKIAHLGALRQDYEARTFDGASVERSVASGGRDREEQP
jgi:hypothetical protein